MKVKVTSANILGHAIEESTVEFLYLADVTFTFTSGTALGRGPTVG